MKKAALTSGVYSSIRSLPQVAVGARFTVPELVAARAFVTPFEVWCQSPRSLLAMRAHGISGDELSNASDYESLEALLKTAKKAVGSTLLGDLEADLSFLTGRASLATGEASEAFRLACDHLASSHHTPSTLLHAHRAALVGVSPRDLNAAKGLGGNIRPLGQLGELLHAAHPDFRESVRALGESTGLPVGSLKELEAALGKHLGDLSAAGAHGVLVDLSDLSLFVRPDPYHAEQVLDVALAGKQETLTPSQLALFSAQILRAAWREMSSLGLRLMVRVCPKTEHVRGHFSVAAFEKLLAYLGEKGAFVPTLLSLAAGDLPRGLTSLIGRFTDAAGKPLLYFGIEGAGAGSTELSRSLRYYLRWGAAPLLLGITDDERGFFTAPARDRFCRVLAEELVAFALRDAQSKENGSLFTEQALISLASDIVVNNAAAFFNV